ncbi:hypothetical protein WJX75_001098 [Coccomyxa subellipsoidea]|uniref:Alcohol oxidase n=2 Tax=Coccomyxa subellipsoidea TaxID=248742 RepID=A0ABR2YUN5_9CHLO
MTSQYVFPGTRPATRASVPPIGKGAHGSAGRRALQVKATLKSENPAAEKYDYILVGGGTAGCVLANRLTADGTKKVLMLEAGGVNEAKEVRTPIGLLKLFKSALDWNLYSTPQHAANERSIYLARGKLLGGSSATNATLYHRGSAADYDAWGVPGWTSLDAIKWFIQAKNNCRGIEDGVHGTGGLMRVENPRYNNPLHEVFFQAAKQAGIPENDNFNDWRRSQVGYGEFQVTQSRVAVSRGVTFQLNCQDGNKHSAELAPGGEVVLCAGSIHLPQILQLSGIGPQGQLREKGIPVVVDLPGVGKNMQDHPACLSSFYLKESAGPISLTDELLYKNGKLRRSAILKYLLFGKGPLATTGCDHGAFVCTAGQSKPDLQIRFVPGLALDPDGVGSYVMFGKNKDYKWPSGITFQLLNVRPKGAGADLSTLRSGIKLARHIAAQPACAAFVASELHPGAPASSDAAIDEFIRDTVHSGNANVGTCSMAAAPGGNAVVDPCLRVFGVRGLRVADASVIPVIPGGQTGAATVMVAERAAQILLGSAVQQLSAPVPAARLTLA